MDYSQTSLNFQMEHKYNDLEEEIFYLEPVIFTGGIEIRSQNYLNYCESDSFGNPFNHETNQYKNLLLDGQVITQNSVLLSTNCSQLPQNQSQFEFNEDFRPQFYNPVQQLEEDQIKNNLNNEQHYLQSTNNQTSFPAFKSQNKTETPIQGGLDSYLHQEGAQINNIPNLLDWLNLSEQNQQEDEMDFIDNNTFKNSNTFFFAPPTQEAALAQEAAEIKKKQQESKNMINVFMYRIKTEFKGKWKDLLNLEVEDYCSLTKFIKRIVALKPIAKTDFIYDIIESFKTYEVEILPVSKRIKNKQIYPKYIRAFKNLLIEYSKLNKENPNGIKRVYLKDFLLP